MWYVGGKSNRRRVNLHINRLVKERVSGGEWTVGLGGSVVPDRPRM